MTKLMEQAIEKLRSLPDEKQDTVAGFVLSELEADTARSSEQARLRPVLTPSDPRGARRLIHDPESALENF
jgi:hypothetical protein